MARHVFNLAAVDDGTSTAPLPDLFARAIAKRVRVGAIAAEDAVQALAIVGFSADKALAALEGAAS